MDSVFQRNKGRATLQEISQFLKDERALSLDSTASPVLLASYEYAPLTSIDIERSFSRLKEILVDERLSFRLFVQAHGCSVYFFKLTNFSESF